MSRFCYNCPIKRMCVGDIELEINHYGESPGTESVDVIAHDEFGFKTERITHFISREDKTVFDEPKLREDLKNRIGLCNGATLNICSALSEPVLGKLVELQQDV